jgi:hypothetical protein
MTVTTPTTRSVLRRSLFWVGLVIVILVGVLITALLFRSAAPDAALAADNPKPAGAQALAHVLADRGVAVNATDDLEATEAALSDAAGAATLLVYDPDLILDADAYRSLARGAQSLVLIDPSFDALTGAAPAVAQAGTVEISGEDADAGSDGLEADCDLPAAVRAGSITATGEGYRAIDDDADVTECFGSDDDVHSLVEVRDGERSVTAVGAATAFDNEHIVLEGNAALAIGLLGERDRLIWYIPGIDDYPAGAPTAADLTPGWVTPVVVLALLTAIAAAVWRGRRFGALVIERLPVLVRASETMEGRARLYARASARLRAADSLRIGTISRLASACGLSRLASVEDVIAAVVSATGADARGIRYLLVDHVPSDDRDLVRLSDDLLNLEKTVTDAVRPSGPQGE